MTDVLTIDDMKQIAKSAKDIKLEEKANEKINKIQWFLAIKKSKELEKFINKSIVKDNDIRNGKATIKGTRITPVELIYFAGEILKENRNTTYTELKKYLYEQYPSINNENQIRAALCYVIKYEISSFKYIISVLIND